MQNLVVGFISHRNYSSLVYDIESRTVLHSVAAHEDDVNSVCFSEPTSSQVVFSGSDDGTVKVWYFFFRFVSFLDASLLSKTLSLNPLLSGLR